MNTIVAIALIVILSIALIFTIATACNIANESAYVKAELVKVKTMFKTAYAISDDTTKKVLDEIDDEK
nr:MAG TPA: hypothetical protein [Caudoviricetes sp.]